MRSIVFILLSLLSCTAQVAHAWTIELTEDELQTKVNRALPIEKKKLLFTVRVSSIDVELKEGSERVGLVADMEIKTPHLSTGKGRAYIDGKLVYNPADGAFYLREPRVTEVKFENIPVQYHRLVGKILQRAITRRLAKTPVYKLNDNKTKHQVAKILLKSVRVVDQKLVLELGLF